MPANLAGDSGKPEEHFSSIVIFETLCQQRHDKKSIYLNFQCTDYLLRPFTGHLVFIG